jgi:Bacterial TniB protein
VNVSELAHLDEDVRPLFDQNVEERIAACFGYWIGYIEAERCIGILERLYQMKRRSRMPNFLVTALTHNGKTSVIERFCELHPGSENLEGARSFLPVLNIEVPPRCDGRELCRMIATQLGAPYKSSWQIGDFLEPLTIQCAGVGTRLIGLDEIHNILGVNRDVQRATLATIRTLGNKLKLPIAAFGTDASANAIRLDPQLENRFRVVNLPAWKLDERFASLINSIERRLPLRLPSLLSGDELIVFIHEHSHGAIGEVTRLIGDAASAAIESGEERITLAALKAASSILGDRLDG